MNMKQHILTTLKEQFNRWEELLAWLREHENKKTVGGIE
ncbi:hypothetical protein ANRL3_01725 [Anaerolineae bacterium]|nr:hypothetical protein ANRL3_01725 [Anaerolineae bacterium]